MSNLNVGQPRPTTNGPPRSMMSGPPRSMMNGPPTSNFPPPRPTGMMNGAPPTNFGPPPTMQNQNARPGPPPPQNGFHNNNTPRAMMMQPRTMAGPPRNFAPPPRMVPSQQKPGGYNAGYPNASRSISQPQAPMVEIDESKQCSREFMRMSVNAVPKTRSQAQHLKFPLGCVVSPLSGDPENVPIVNFGSSGVIRCKKCRTYINPFVTFVDGGSRWKCNVCSFLVETPNAYFAPLDAEGKRQDLQQRPELLKGEVEIIAPAEYMVRPPQAAAYLFVIDVSYTAIQSGLLQVTCDSIKKSLDRLPGAPRTHVGFITFDSAVHFYNLKSSLSQPQMLVMPDTKEPFVPAPDDLLVNLKESRELVDHLLDNLPSMFAKSNNVEVALGPALQCGFKVMHHIGGKMCVMLSSLPSTGAGRLRHRDSVKLYGTDQEHKLFQAQDSFYKARALEMSRQQISVDLFLCPQKYVDVATLSMLPKNTSGELYYYPGFRPNVRCSNSYFRPKYLNKISPSKQSHRYKVRSSKTKSLGL